MIEAACESKADTAHITVAPVPVASITLSPESVTLNVGKTLRIHATTRDGSGNVLLGRAVTWSSNAPQHADVSASGLVAAMSEGTAIVTAQAGTATATASITALAPNPGLTPADSGALTRALNIVSTSGIVAAARDTMLRILWDPSYDRLNWEAFFLGYFRVYGFLDSLFWPFQSDVLGAPDSAVRGHLQMGISNAIQYNITFATDASRGDLSKAFVSDADLRQTVFNSHRFLARMIGTTSLPERIRPDVQDAVYSFYLHHVRDYAEFFRHGSGNLTTLPYIGALRAQAWLNLRDALPLTANRKQQITDALGLLVPYDEIFDRYEVLVIDNGAFSARQLEVIQSVLELTDHLPYRLTAITSNEHLGNTGQGIIWPITGDALPGGGLSWAPVNVFALPVGAASENSFPVDAPTRMVDIFSVVVVHEVNHVVDATYASTVPLSGSRRDALIAAAGTDSLNYLRSMLPSSFFVSFPGEFFASISNQWFTDSENTIRLGRIRFDQGRHEPLNQALYFAEVYSRGGDMVPLYRTDTEGSITRIDTPVTRDSNAHIVSLVVGDSVYSFVRDVDGNVQDYSIGQR